MAKLQASTNEKVFSFNNWLGVNECADGDTNLKYGEAAAMQNFKITNNGSLQVRPGSKNIAGLISAYGTAASATTTTLLTELNTSTHNYKLYPSVTVSSAGILSVSGTAVSVNYANSAAYEGYYYQDGNGNVFKLSGCTLTHPSTGTVVPGGAVSTDEPFFDSESYTITYYESVAVRNGKVVGNGTPGYIAAYADNASSVLVGKYMDYLGAMCLIGGYARWSEGAWLSGAIVSYVGDDTYKWNFYSVSLSTTSTDIAVRGLWCGKVGSTQYLIAACGGFLWNITNANGTWAKTSIGAIATTNGAVHMFGFDTKLYILDGSQYKVWDGTTLSIVTGYRPLVAVSCVPTGGGTSLEQVNKLNGLRRVWFSPTDSATAFQLSETGLTSIDYVKNTVTGTNYALSTDYTVDLTNGKVTFVTGTRTENFTGSGSTKIFTLSNSNANISSITIAGTATTNYTYSMIQKTVTFTNAPSSGAAIVVTENVVPINGTNTIEIGYTFPTNYRSQVTAMRYSETYNGQTDTRVFLYGDGSNEAFYSGLDYNGNPRADYFPDLNEIAVDSANTPITAMIKHFGRLLTFKTDGAYITTYDTITLSDGTTTAAFYTSPLNREIGHAAAGQTVLVKNNPFTLFGKSVYEWQLSSFSAKDERNAKVRSQRVTTTLSQMDLSSAICFDDIYNSEYYIVQNGTAVVYNYVADAWYVYANIPATCMISFNQEIYFGTSDGYIRHLSRDYMNDNGTNIVAYWESGSMSFGADYKRKYSPCLWVGLKPEAYGAVKVTVQTDRQPNYSTEDVLADNTGTVASGFFSFFDLDFTRLSFNINDKPQMFKLKIKVKKFTFYKLIFSSDSNNTTATITGADMRVRYTGDVR